jgi:hypothetical protein
MASYQSNISRHCSAKIVRRTTEVLMSLRIVQLMASPTRDVAWLQDALQSAVELELSTLPPYLSAYWCLKDNTSYPATQLNIIFMEEMLHLGYACNLLRATGKEPEIVAGYGRLNYPGPLPGGVVPACDGGLVPCDPHFQVQIGFASFHAFAWMATQIEYPENPVPRPHFLEAVETVPTIGQFYDAIIAAFQGNTLNIPYDQTHQLGGPLGLKVIDSLDAAIAAMKLIQQQGEGGGKYPFSAPGVLSHFYAFGELYFLKKYQFDAATQKGDWTGDVIPLTDNDWFKMAPVPLGGYGSPPTEVVAFDRSFTQMLQTLESAWGADGKAALTKAIRMMPGLTDAATDLLGKQIARTDAPGIYGPQFKIDTSAPRAGT